jgi:hypothetical protein
LVSNLQQQTHKWLCNALTPRTARREFWRIGLVGQGFLKLALVNAKKACLRFENNLLIGENGLKMPMPQQRFHPSPQGNFREKIGANA